MEAIQDFKVLVRFLYSQYPALGIGFSLKDDKIFVDCQYGPPPL